MTESDAYRRAASARINALQTMLISLIFDKLRRDPNPFQALEEITKAWIGSRDDEADYCAAVREISAGIKDALIANKRRQN